MVRATRPTAKWRQLSAMSFWAKLLLLIALGLAVFALVKLVILALL
jgi:hypothetical protein